MRINASTIFFFLFVSSFLSVNAQYDEDAKKLHQLADNNIDFYHLKTKGGIEQNSITSIAQDTLGQIWFSTKDGLIRYNSKEFFTYKYQSENPRSIQNNFVGRVFIARNGSIWIRTNEGLSKYHIKSDDFEWVTKNEGIEKNIFGIAEDSNGILWFPSDKNTLCSYDDSIKKLRSYTYVSEIGNDNKLNFEQILITKENRIFISTNQAYILEFESKTSSFKPIHFLNNKDLKGLAKRGAYADCMMEDHEGHIWLGTHFGFLLQYDLSNNSFSCYHYKEDIDLKSFCSSMFLFEDHDGNIWTGGWTCGLFKISKDRTKVTHIKSNREKSTSLSNNIVTYGFQDKAGYLWFGTEFAGINILKKNKKFSVIANEPNELKSLPAHPYLDAVTDRSNRVWIATDGGGLYYFDKGNKAVHHTGTSIIGNEIRVFSLLNDSKGFIWLGTGNGLFKYHPITKEVVHYPSKYETDYNSPGGKNIVSLCEDYSGNIWMGSIKGGLTKLDVEKNTFYRFTPDKDNPNSLSYKYVSSIYCDSNNDIWVGTLDGLNKFNPAAGNFTIFKVEQNNSNTINSNTIYCMYESHGSLWIGTKGGGLNEYNLQTKKFSYYLQADGLPSNNVKGINSDRNGNLWISSTRNLSKFDLSSNQFITYSASDGLYNEMYVKGYGLQELEFLEKFAYRDQDGFLYFGGMGGMFCFHPDSLPQNEYQAPILIDEILVNGEILKINGKNEIKLKPNQNHLEFSLTVLNFIQADKNQYAYYLENSDSIWVYKGTESHIEYFDLPPGKYAFYYKGANNDGLWSDAGPPLIIHIKARFYQSYLFYILIFIFIILLVISYVYYKWYIKRQLEKQKQLMRYSQSNLDEKLAEKINQKLKQSLEKEELYLEANLSLHKLAKIIETKPHYLSQVINQYHHCNFHEFINTYRIKVAKDLLIKTQLKIEAIAYDSGFNSISTFNVAFKKETGLTPSAFKKSLD